MKNKKLMAITLCIGIAVSSFGGYITGYSQYDSNEFTVKKLDAGLDNSGTTTLPSLNLVEMKPEAINPENTPYDKNMTASGNEGEILYEGTKSTLDPGMQDIYNIGGEEIEAMMQEGYTVEDIFEADKIGNETGIEPETLLEEKAAANKSLEQIKKDILEENREKAFAELKGTYPKEYEKLKSKKLKESEIMNLLAYADVNNVKVTDELIAAYQKSGEKLFQKTTDETKESQISQATKNKYQLSDAEAEGLSAELISKLEELSKKTGKTVEELVKGYHKGNDNKKK